MAWDIASTPISNQQLGKLRNNLLLSYLLVTSTILGVFTGVVYAMVARDLHWQLNHHLSQLATTAAGTLEIIQHEYQEVTTQSEYAGYISPKADGTYPPMTLFELMGKYRADSVASLVPNSLTPENQGVEWFSAQRALLVQEGTLFPAPHLPELTIPQGTTAAGIWVQQGSIRSFVLPVYRPSPQAGAELIGYVRASESTDSLERELRRLRERLALGVVIVSGLVTLGGIWLSRRSLQPVLVSLEQLKQFTADASHELRNPLTAIRASVAVMQSHPERVHPGDRDKLKAIASASAQMSQLVDDLLLLARMDRQAPDQATWRLIALDELLDDVINLYSHLADQAEIHLNSQLAPHLNVKGDAAQLQQLFTNLLTNALHYTPAGGSVTLTLHRSGLNAIVRVEDTGIGIAADQLPYIFDRFWRADQARSHCHDGSGLGLAIAKALAQRHGGSLEVQSVLTVGSCFQVRLPLA